MQRLIHGWTSLLTFAQKKTRALDEIHEKYGDRDSDLERTLREKEEELEVYKAGMDDALLQLNELRVVCFYPRSPRCCLPKRLV